MGPRLPGVNSDLKSPLDSKKVLLRTTVHCFELIFTPTEGDFCMDIRMSLIGLYITSMALYPTLWDDAGTRCNTQNWGTKRQNKKTFWGHDIP